MVATLEAWLTLSWSSILQGKKIIHKYIEDCEKH